MGLIVPGPYSCRGQRIRLPKKCFQAACPTVVVVALQGPHVNKTIHLSKLSTLSPHLACGASSEPLQLLQEQTANAANPLEELPAALFITDLCYC